MFQSVAGAYAGPMPSRQTLRMLAWMEDLHAALPPDGTCVDCVQLIAHSPIHWEVHHGGAVHRVPCRAALAPELEQEQALALNLACAPYVAGWVQQEAVEAYAWELAAQVCDAKELALRQASAARRGLEKVVPSDSNSAFTRPRF